MTKLVDLDAVLAAIDRISPDGEYDTAWRTLCACKETIRALPAQPAQAGSEAVQSQGNRLWCQPSDVPHREFMVTFDDVDRGYATFDNEAEAREFFRRADVAWTCHLFATLPIDAAPAAPRDPVAVVEVTDAMVEAAVAASREWDNGRSAIPPIVMRGALRAALRQSQEGTP